MAYVDGYVIPVRRETLQEFLRLSRELDQVWIDNGALAITNCVGDDVPYGEITSFPRAVQAKDDEVLVFGWVRYPDRATRDACNAKLMADPRMQNEELNRMMDGKRMIFGGFTVSHEI